MGRPHSLDRNDEVSATTGGKVAEDPAKGLFHRSTVSVEHLYSEPDVAQQAKPLVVHVALDGWPPERAWRRLDVQFQLCWPEILRLRGVARTIAATTATAEATMRRVLVLMPSAPLVRLMSVPSRDRPANSSPRIANHHIHCCSTLLMRLRLFLGPPRTAHCSWRCRR